jgi:hypothetical protein
LAASSVGSAFVVEASGGDVSLAKITIAARQELGDI